MNTKTDLVSSIQQHLDSKTIFGCGSSYKRNVKLVAIIYAGNINLVLCTDDSNVFCR